MSRTTITALVVIGGLCLFLAAGCGDDDDGTVTGQQPTITLYGKWEVLSGFSARYMNFNADNTYDFLYEANFGFRTLESGVCLVTTSQVVYGLTPFNYFVKADTLVLWQPGDTIMALRNAQAPTASQWVLTATTLSSFDAPIDEATDPAWHGGYLWYGNAYASDYLYKIDVATGLVAESLHTVRSAWAVEWTGDSLWVSSNGSGNIFRVDTLTGSTQFTSADMGAWIEGLAWDGQYLWCGSHNARTIYQYEPATNTVVDTFYVDFPIHGMAYVNGHLYVCVFGVINVCSVAPLQVIGAYAITGYVAEGIAYDGTNFWVTATDYPEHKIFQTRL